MHIQLTKSISKSIIVILAFVFVAQLNGQITKTPRVIPEKEAQDLLRTYLRSKGYDTERVQLDIELEPGAEARANPNFYLYDVYADTSQRLVTIGAYAVNNKTADIWERIDCRRIDSKAVASSQKKFRESSGLHFQPSEASKEC